MKKNLPKKRKKSAEPLQIPRILYLFLGGLARPKGLALDGQCSMGCMPVATTSPVESQEMYFLVLALDGGCSMGCMPVAATSPRLHTGHPKFERKRIGVNRPESDILAHNPALTDGAWWVGRCWGGFFLVEAVPLLLAAGGGS